MGQKVPPLIQRVGYIKDWESTWISSKKNLPQFIEEDYYIRKFLQDKAYPSGSVSKVKIGRDSEKSIRVKIHTARPGVVIGRRGKDIERVLWPLPARKLLGIGPKTEGYLKAMGIAVIGELASLPLADLVERFGTSYGNYLYRASRGIDESPLITHWEPKSMSRETTFQVDVDNWQAIAKTIAELTRQVVSDMRESNYAARTFTLKVRFSDFETLTRAKTLPRLTHSEEEIRRAVFECLKRVELRKKVRLLGVRAGNLKKMGEAGLTEPH